MTPYDPDITFEANARRLLEHRGVATESNVADALRAAYADGWRDARARQLAGAEISEVPFKD